MGLQDLGELFYKPINDGNGSIVLGLVNQITDSKQVGNIASSLKWQSQSKLVRNSQQSDPLLPLLNVRFIDISLAIASHNMFVNWRGVLLITHDDKGQQAAIKEHA